MYKIAICEDDSRYITYLEKAIVESNVIDKEKLQFFEFQAGEHLVNSQTQDFDLVILDMQLGSIDGYRTAVELRRWNRNFVLVFCSGVVNICRAHVKVNPFRYLTKASTHQQMLDEMRQILTEVKKRRKVPFVMCRFDAGYDRLRVYADSIFYIAIRGKGTAVHVCEELRKKSRGEPFKANLNIKEMETIFNVENGFSRIHNSYLVNMAYIMSESRDGVVLEDGTPLPVSRARKLQFRENFAEYLTGKYKGD